MNSSDRRMFDDLLDAIIAELPEHLTELFEEVPVIVEDEPSDELLDDMDIDPEDTNLCGLHWGVPLTQRSVEHSGTLPDRIMLFRGPIIRTAMRRSGRVSRRALERQIRITLLHEIGHHFGLSEGDLEALGYG